MSLIIDVIGGEGIAPMTITNPLLVPGNVPLDARSMVQYKSDLINLDTWKDINENEFWYIGMLVSVVEDGDENNGVYQLRQIVVPPPIWGRDSELLGPPYPVAMANWIRIDKSSDAFAEWNNTVL